MTDTKEQERLAIQAKIDRDSIFTPSRGMEIAALYQRPQSNSGALNPQEYLDMAIPAWRKYCVEFGITIPDNVHASDSAPTGFRKPKADAKAQESRQHNNLVTVWKTGKDGDESREWRIYIANQVENPIDVLTCLLGGLLLTAVGYTKTEKFPQGELTFKSDLFDEYALKVGFLKKYRGNLASSVSITMLNAANQIRANIGDCPIKAIIPQDPAEKSGLKQKAENYKADCENALCDALQLGDKKNFSIANISKYQHEIMQKTGAKLPCPICNPHADPKGSFMRVYDPRAEKEAKELAAAAKKIADAEKAKADKIAAKAKADAEELARAEAIAKDKATRDAAIAAAKAETLAKIAAKEQATPEPEKAPLAAVVANNVATTGKGKSANKGKAS